MRSSGSSIFALPVRSSLLLQEQIVDPLAGGLIPSPAPFSPLQPLVQWPDSMLGKAGKGACTLCSWSPHCRPLQVTVVVATSHSINKETRWAQGHRVRSRARAETQILLISSSCSFLTPECLSGLSFFPSFIPASLPLLLLFCSSASLPRFPSETA